MYSSETISECDTPGCHLGETDCALEITPKDHQGDYDRKEKSNGIAAKRQTNGSSGTNLKSLYNHALSNDNIVIVETTPASQRPPKTDVYRNSGGQADRASRTIRGLADDELPHPDVVRRAKDMFETLAKKHRQEVPLKRHQSSVQDFSKPCSTIGRTQSMLVLSGRSWGNSLSRTPMLIRNNDYNYPKAPAYQRSCSELDKFFQEDEDDEDDPWEAERGSPVSPEVIQKIRDQGTCVQFFGSDAYVVENGDSDDVEDAFLEEKTGYLLEYPYELYPNDDSVSSKPKIIGSLPKTSSGSCASSMSSAYGGRETPSPAPPSPYGGYNGWFGVSLDDIRASLKLEDSDGSRASSSLSSGYVRLKQPCNGHRIAVAIERRHGKWMKNPYWQGSYYVIYDFTQKHAEPSFRINGN